MIIVLMESGLDIAALFIYGYTIFINNIVMVSFIC